jgi:tetratricopeptide (TPR) repeat protein
MPAFAQRLAVSGLLLLAQVSTAGERSTGWSEVQTAHVTLKTDLDPEEARRAALAVENTRAALLAAAWPGAKLLQPDRVEVVVFAKQSDFRRYFGRELLGLFIHFRYPPTFFLYGPPEKWERRMTLAREETNSLLKHELTHHLAAYIYRRQPRWFAEGLAQYLETLRFSEDGKTATLGDINLEAVQAYNLARNTSLGVADALAWGGKLDAKDEMANTRLYGLSWLMVHWMSNSHPAEYERFQTLLAKGIDPDKAWKAVFPNLAPSDIDKQLHQYVLDGDYHPSVVAIPPPDGAVRERPMTSAEVHATRAAAALAGAAALMHGAEQFADAQAELAAALADDPGNVRALRMKMGLVKPEERLALGRLATEGHPDDGLAWLTLGETLPDTPENWEERAQAFKKSTALLPDNPTAFNDLAWMYVRKGQPQQALPLAITAAQMAPWNSAILDTLAGALAGVHRCSEAVAMEARAVDMLPERSSPAGRAEYVRRLAEFQQKCSEAAAVPTSPSADAGVGASVPTDAGTSNREAVRQVVREHLMELRDCYEAELVRSRAADSGTDPNGKVEIRWTIADGAVTSVELVSATPGIDKHLSGCVANAIRGWRFPIPQGGTTVVTYPFTFKKPEASQP